MTNTTIVLPENHYIDILPKIINTQEYIYFILDIDNNLMKIGKSKNPAKRLKALETCNPFNLKIINLIQYISCDKTIFELESLLHQIFNKYHKKGEWFYFEGNLRYYVWCLIGCYYNNKDNYSYYLCKLTTYLDYLNYVVQDVDIIVHKKTMEYLHLKK